MCAPGSPLYLPPLFKAIFLWEVGLRSVFSKCYRKLLCTAIASWSPVTVIFTVTWRVLRLCQGTREATASWRNSQLQSCIYDMACMGSVQAHILKLIIPCEVLWRWNFNLTVVFGDQHYQGRESGIECWWLYKERGKEIHRNTCLLPQSWDIYTRRPLLV